MPFFGSSIVAYTTYCHVCQTANVIDVASNMIYGCELYIYALEMPSVQFWYLQ